ncbi:hypothetical protein, partial [Nocardia brasiliensis]|uniref:hypothetical protein n=1 Tax=Nocardia brasiliensis TaxID=37326 RepID=UPI0024574A0E
MTGRVVQAPAALLGQSIEPLTDWAFSVLAEHGLTVTGAPVETRRRAWSLVVRIPTSAGPMWAKANARAFAHEGHLLELLARLCPGSALEPVAVQQDRGWLLSRHGGDVAPDTAAEWTELVRAYAELQQSLTTHIDELRATGTPYLPPARLVTVYQHYEPRIPGLGDRIGGGARGKGAEKNRRGQKQTVHPPHPVGAGFDSVPQAVSAAAAKTPA